MKLLCNERIRFAEFSDLLAELVICCEPDATIQYLNASAQQWCPDVCPTKTFFAMLLPESQHKGRLFFEKACAATDKNPTTYWELILGTATRYAVASFRGYHHHNTSTNTNIIILVAQTESERFLDIQRHMNELNTELAEAQRELHRHTIKQRRFSEEQLRMYQTELEYQKKALDAHCIVAIIDKHGKITYVNNRFCEFSQYSKEELVGQSFRILNAGFHTKHFLHNIFRTVLDGNVWNGEIISRRKDASIYILNTTIVPFRDVRGQPYQYVMVCTDITLCKQAKELEQDRNLVLEMVARDQDLFDILKQIALMIRHQCTDVACTVLLLQDDILMYAASAGLPEYVLIKLNNIPFQPDFCPAYSQLCQLHSVTIQDITTDPLCSRCQEIALVYDMQSCWTVPVVSREGKVLGIIILYYASKRTISAFDVQLVDTASDLAAIAIEQRILADKLVYQAYHDTITGLPNRLLFDDRLKQALTYTRQHCHLLAVLLIDLDRFKHINSTFGHAVGDILLYQVAQRFRQTIRPDDTLARMGGDEFALIIADLTSPQDVMRQAQRMLDALTEPFLVRSNQQLFVNASIGISLYPSDGDNAAMLLSSAEAAMYQAKSLTSNSFQFSAPDVNITVAKQFEVETLLRQAIERGELVLYYQPQTDMQGHLMGVEALLRWFSPQLGYVSPSTFIPLAEESGLIKPIGMWVLHQACQQAMQWQQRGFAPFKVAVNVSAVQFVNNDFVDTVAHALHSSHLAPQWLDLELTESVVMHKYDDLALQLARLRDIGIGIAVDDFGTGYSSFSYLQKLPIDLLKIDRSFVEPLVGDEVHAKDSLAIVRAITMMAHSLNMHVLVEGVDMVEKIRLLQQVDCDYMQGNILSKPISAQELEVFLHDIHLYNVSFFDAVHINMSATDMVL